MMDPRKNELGHRIFNNDVIKQKQNKNRSNVSNLFRDEGTVIFVD